MPTAKRRRTGRKPPEAWAGYLFEIGKVHAHYSFGRGSHLDWTAFSEYLHPQFDAICLAPEKFKGRTTRFTLIGDRKLEHDLWMQVSAPSNETGVGQLTMRGQQSDYLGSLPYDAAWRLGPMILAGGFRYLYLHGAPMFRGTARIHSIGFYEEFDIDDV